MWHSFDMVPDLSVLFLNFLSIDKSACFVYMASYFEDMSSKSEVIDPPHNEDTTDVGETVNDSASSAAVKSNVTVSTSVRELLECPVCLNAMYPPIHQVWFGLLQYNSFFNQVIEICVLGHLIYTVIQK